MSSDQRMLSPFQTAATLIQSFYSQGIRHAVISPGSRSTPLTLALAHHDGYTKIVVLDERSAAFMALGIGKESGNPAILVCTSGTAAANYFPAIVEAKQSGVPILVLTADRPPHLRGIGSPQTIDQIKLYGNYAVFFHEMGEPAEDTIDTERIKFLAKQAVVESIRKGGAAHLNLPFRKPLEPSGKVVKVFQNKTSQQMTGYTPVQASATRTVTPAVDISDLINRSQCPFILAGPANRFHSNEKTVFQLAETLHAPVVAEPGSRLGHHANRIHHYEQFLRNDMIRTGLKPDLILRFGDQPFTKSILSVLEHWNKVPTIRFDVRHSWQDHAMATDHIIELHPEDSFVLGSEVPVQHDYLKKWMKTDTESSSKLTTLLENESTLTDGHVFHYVSNTIGIDWNLMLSNSLPPRDAALFGKPHRNVTVNRGAAGIDGILSTAIGVALATKSPTCCIVGDLALLHDSNALLSLQKLTSPFMIIVINNSGGNIFRMLPVYERTEIYQTYFETPQMVDIKALAKSHNIHYKQVREKEKLNQITFKNKENNYPILIECVTNADAGMALREKLWNGQNLEIS